MAAESPRLILPGKYVDATGVVRLAPPSLVLGENVEEALKVMGGQAPFLVVGTAPSFHDQIDVYATHQELFELLGGSPLELLHEFLEPTVDEIVARVETIPFEPATRFLASLQKGLALARRDRVGQMQLVRAVYGNSVIAVACARFLRANEHGVIFSEQQLFALQRLLVLHARDEPADDLAPDENLSLRMALLYMPGTVLAADPELDEEAPTGIEDERWVRYFVGNGGLVGHGALRHDLARAHRMYEVIAKSSAARQHRDYCPLDEWLHARYGLSFVELQAFGFGLHAGSKIGDEESPPIAITSDYFQPTRLANRVERGFEAIAAEREWFREEFNRSPEHPRRAAFEIQPFLRRPALRQRDGRIIVLAPRAIEGWLSSTGAYYRFFDLARERGEAKMQRFRRFNGWIQERYVRHLVHVAHPRQDRRTLPGSGRVIPEISYRVRQGESKTSDVAIDLGIDLVLIEVTAKRITVKSLVEADATAVRNDLSMLIVENMKQLGRVIADVFAGDVSIPQVAPEHVKRVWPIIVSPDSLFQNPSLWAYIQEKGGAFLDFPRNEVPAEVRPLVVLDLEEFEILMAIVARGDSLVGALERKTSPGWVERDFKSWHSDDSGRVGSGESVFLAEELRRAFRAVISTLAIPRKVGSSMHQEREAA